MHIIESSVVLLFKTGPPTHGLAKAGTHILPLSTISLAQDDVFSPSEVIN